MTSFISKAESPDDPYELDYERGVLNDYRPTIVMLANDFSMMRARELRNPSGRQNITIYAAMIGLAQLYLEDICWMLTKEIVPKSLCVSRNLRHLTSNT